MRANVRTCFCKSVLYKCVKCRFCRFDEPTNRQKRHFRHVIDFRINPWFSGRGDVGMNFCGLFENVHECLKMCSQKVRRKNAHGVNLLIFNITNLIFLIRFLRFFRFSRICPTSKFSKYSKDSNWLLITHHSYLFPRYHPVTTPKGYRKDTEVSHPEKGLHINR